VCECGGELAGATDLGVVDAYQQIEIPWVAAKLTQYDQHAVVCGCGKAHTATRPEGARDGKIGYGPNPQAWAVFLMVVHFVPVRRCAQILESLTGTAPSAGFVHSMLKRAAALVKTVNQRIRALIVLAHAVCLDETPLKVGSKTPKPGKKKAERYLLVARTKLYTLYPLGDRSLDTFKASVPMDLKRTHARRSSHHVITQATYECPVNVCAERCRLFSLYGRAAAPNNLQAWMAWVPFGQRRLR
jgi:transposase